MLMPAIVGAIAAKTASRSWRRYPGASSFGNVLRSCWAVQAAVGWSVSHVNEPPAVVRQDDEHEEHPEGDRRDDEQVRSHDLAGVIGQERAPRL
jgi:hypothetical protein